MAYTQPTLTEAIAALASRLNDQSNVHWVPAELTTYLREALRTWNVWTSHWRDRASFTTTINQAFYDLPTEISTLRGQTLTNWDLIADLQYALMEPAAVGGTWTGTDQFTLAQLSSALQRRRDQFLRETGVQLTRTETPYASPPASGRLALDESVLVVRRARWTPDATAFGRPLLRTDDWAANHYAPAWPASTTDSPSAYSVSTVPPLTLQLITPATTDGTLDLIAINAGAAIDPVVQSLLGIPDDYAWVIKYGALADLLSGDGLSLDPARAQYCETRWLQGLGMARANPVVLAGRINNVPCRVGAIADADAYSPLWQLVAGVPRSLLLTGQNLLASWPPPGATGGPWTITLDVVQNAPVPAIGADILQISSDVYDSILDLAQHTALVKEGPGQIQIATALLERAARAAGVTTMLQQASDPDRAAAQAQQQQDRRGMSSEQQAAVPQTVEG